MENVVAWKSEKEWKLRAMPQSFNYNFQYSTASEVTRTADKR